MGDRKAGLDSGAKAGANAEPAGGKRTRRPAQEVRARVLAAAAQAFDRFGYSGATTAEIARDADVTQAQIFRYFASKAELFEAAVFEPLNRSFAEFNAQMLGKNAEAGFMRDSAAGYIAELQDFMEKHSRTLLTMIVARGYEKGSGALAAVGTDLQEYFEMGAAEMLKRTNGRPAVRPELLVRVSFAAVLGCALFKDWMFPPTLASEKEIRQATIDFILDGVNVNAAPD
jgi:AcrR family transcriptional regulator